MFTEPNSYANYGQTATTVGYGEVQVTTHFGRLVCAICGLVGMLLNALIIAALSQVLERIRVRVVTVHPHTHGKHWHCTSECQGN